jgi:two-component system sensor histidine kinase RegB
MLRRSDASTTATRSLTAGASPLPLPTSRSAAIQTLIALRWGLIGCELLAAAFSAWVVDQKVATSLFLFPWLAQLLSNAGLSMLIRRGNRIVHSEERLVVIVLGFDIACLTWLIHSSGGVANPFSSLFVVHALVATLVLPRWGGVIFAALACLGYGLVFILETGGRVDSDALEEIGHGMHSAVAGHLIGMWVSLVLTIVVATSFVVSLSRRLRLQTDDLVRARADAAEAARVAELTSFAAGAAHELSTPLSTIAVVAGEAAREWAVARTPEPDHVAAAREALRRDLELIRDEVGRCQRIIQSLRYEHEPASTLGPEQFQQRLHDELNLLLGESAMARLRTRFAFSVPVRAVPVRALAHATAALLRNAIEASPPGRQVDLDVTSTHGGLRLTVRDEGHGIPEADLARVQEPFFSTKSPGTALGLGLFLARVICSQLHASLTLRSAVGQGTLATIEIPGVGEGS